MELISREEMLQKIREMPIEYFGRSLTRKSVIMGELEELPTIESRPKGKWETVSREKGACEIFFTNKKCSNCGYEYCFPFNYKYCPECGADMEGEKQ